MESIYIKSNKAKGLFFIGIFSIFSSVSFSAFAEDNSINVAIAANLSFVINDLKTEFKNETGIDIKTISGSSGKLTAQIENGAPFDIFLSADMNFPEKLYKDKFTNKKPEIYAYGQLVLWTSTNISGVSDLNSSLIKKVAVANPKTAPYGRETINLFNYYKISDSLKDKIVYGDSISQVNNFIMANSVDAAFTSKSSVLSPEMKSHGKWYSIDKKSYNPIAQGIVILNNGLKNNSEKTKKFYNFIFSKKAKSIFLKYGYN